MVGASLGSAVRVSEERPVVVVMVGLAVDSSFHRMDGLVASFSAGELSRLTVAALTDTQPFTTLEKYLEVGGRQMDRVLGHG